MVLLCILDSALPFCFIPKDDKIFVKSQDEETFKKSHYSELVKKFSLRKKMDSGKGFWYGVNDDTYYYEIDKIDDPESLHENRNLLLQQAQQNQDLIPNIEEIIDEKTLEVTIKRNNKSYIPNGIRLVNLASKYQGCIQYSGMFGKLTNHVLTEYLIPMDEYILPIKDIDSIQDKIKFFATVADIFKDAVNTLALLHSQEFF